MAVHAHCVSHKRLPTAVSAELCRSAAHAGKVPQLTPIARRRPASCPPELPLGKLLGIGRDRANQKSRVLTGIRTCNGCCKPECEVSICDLLAERQGFMFVFVFFKHHSGHTPLWTPDWDPRASVHLPPAPSAALSAFVHQMGLRGCSHLSLQHPFCSRVGAGSCLGFPSLPISCLLPSLPPVSPAPSLVLKFSYLTKHKHPHPGIPKRIPRDISHPRHELAPCSLPPTLLWHEHPSLRQKEQPSQMWMILPQASRTAQ